MSLCGCGLNTPSLDPEYKDKYQAVTFTAAIANHVHCELRQAVKEIYSTGATPWLADWAAKVALTVTVDEKSSLNPGVALTSLYPGAVTNFANKTSATTPQSFNLGFGGLFAADATRVESVTFYIIFKDLLAEPTDAKACSRDDPAAIAGDLHIFEGLNSGLVMAAIPNAVSAPYINGGPLDTITHHVTFEVDASGNATPTWRLVNVSASANSPLLSAGRIRKDDLLITMGPTQLSSAGRTTKKQQRIPSASLENVFNAQLYGQATATAIRSSQ
jgi:hypothetical protein